jgi:single-strand DNA-binding protein
MRDIATATPVGKPDPRRRVRALPSGAEAARLRVATTTRRRSGEEWVDKTNYFTVEVYGAQARSCKQYLHKGSRVFVDAELDWREWTDPDDKKRKAVTFKARQVLFEGGRPTSAATQGSAQQDGAGPEVTTQADGEPVGVSRGGTEGSAGLGRRGKRIDRNHRRPRPRLDPRADGRSPDGSVKSYH